MANPTVIASVAKAYASSTSSGASAGITTTGATKLLAFVVGGASSHTISDSKSNSWAQIGTTITASSYPNYVSVWQTSSSTPTVGTGHTFTGGSASGGYPSIFVVAIGPSAGGALTVGTPVSGADSTSPFVSPGLTTDPALMIGFYAPINSGTSAPTHGNSFTGLDTIGATDAWCGATSQRAVTSSGTYNTSITDTSGAPSETLNWLVAVTEAGGGATTRTLTASLTAAVQAARTATATAAAAIQAARTATVSATAAVQQAKTVTASSDAAVQAAITATTTATAAVQDAHSATSTIDAAVQEGKTVSSSATAAVSEARTATATLAAAVQSALSVGASVDAAVLAALSVSATISAYVAESGASVVSATLTAAIQAARDATASLDAAIQDSHTATATVDAAVAEARAVAVTADAAVQAPVSVQATLSAAVVAAVTATATLSAAVSVAQTASATVDAYISATNTATATIDAAVQASVSVSATISAYIVTEATDSEKIALILKILANKQELDPATGTFRLYDDDGTTLLYEVAAWEDSAGTIPYRGRGLQKLDRLE